MSQERRFQQGSKAKVELLSRRLADLSRTMNDVSFDADMRRNLQQVNELQETVRRLGVAVVEGHGILAKGSKARLREYFRRHKDKVIDGYELELVAGIPTYARRIRELRDEGMQILSGSSETVHSNVSLGPDQYLYVG